MSKQHSPPSWRSAPPAWSPLAGGVLTGKYIQQGGSGAPSGGSGRYHDPAIRQFHRSDSDRVVGTVTAVGAVAEELGRSSAQVALAWLRQRAQPIIPIIGARKLSQFQDNLACLDLELDPKQLDRLTTASRIELGFHMIST